MAQKIIIALLIGLPTFGFQLKTEELAMDLPKPWECKAEKELWLCDEQTSGRQKNVVILVQARKALPKETYNYFRDQLKAPRSSKGKSGTPLLSRVVSMQDRIINGVQWFEAIHFDGELDGYYTQYIATRRGDFSYLITMSAHKAKWDGYKNIFQSITSSLRALAPDVVTVTQVTQTNTPINVQNPSAAQFKPTSPLHEPLNLPIPGLTPFRLILFFGLAIAGYLFLYALRSL